MIDPYLIWTPILALPVVGLLRFLGCAAVAGLGSDYTAAAGPLGIVDPGPLPEGAENQPYPGKTFQAIGGTPPYTWSMAPVSPGGLTINPMTGVLGGTPSSGFDPSVTVTVTVMDSTGLPKQVMVNLNVLGITTNSLPQAQLNSQYAVVLGSVGGVGHIKWTISGQPQGLVIRPGDNTIKGPPTQSGAFTVTVVATDANNVSTSTQLQLNVAEPLTVLFNTGVDASGNLLASGAPDIDYQLFVGSLGNAEQNSYVADPATLPGPWSPNGPKSQWIAPQAEGGVPDAAGDYYYVTTFDLTGLDPTTASITVTSWSDNEAFYTLNPAVNHAPEQPLSTGPDHAFAVTIPLGSAFINGVNTLVFRVHNDPVTPVPPSTSTANPTGLRVEMTGAAVPQP